MRIIDKINAKIDRHKDIDMLVLNPNSAAILLDELADEMDYDIEFDEMTKFFGIEVTVCPDLQYEYKLAKYIA